MTDPASLTDARNVRSDMQSERSGKTPPATRGRCRDPGWSVVGGKGFLGLTRGEAAVLEVRAALAAHLKRSRDALQLRQQDVARYLDTSQSRVAKMEAGDPTVSLDLLLNALVVLGARKLEIAQVIAWWPDPPPCPRLEAQAWLSAQGG